MSKNMRLSIEDIHPHLRYINLFQCRPCFKTGFRRIYDQYFLYVHKGKGIITIEDSSYNAVSGDLFFCPPGISNSVEADYENPFLLTGINFDFTYNHRTNSLMYPIDAEMFNPANVTEYINFTDFEGFPNKIALPEDESIRMAIYTMINEFNLKKKHYNTYLNGILQGLIINVVQRARLLELGIENRTRMDEIIHYLMENYAKDLTNASVARIFHYHPEYISRIVFTYTGLTLKQYIIDLRIRASLNMLIHSNMDIKAISYNVGYDNLQYFYRIFKKKTGYTPGNLRSKSR